MTELEYVPWADGHCCLLPPLHDVKREAGLKIGTEWTCPDCGLLHVVVKRGSLSLDWISYGPAAPLQRQS